MIYQISILYHNSMMYVCADAYTYDCMQVWMSLSTQISLIVFVLFVIRGMKPILTVLVLVSVLVLYIPLNVLQYDMRASWGRLNDLEIREILWIHSEHTSKPPWVMLYKEAKNPIMINKLF